MESQLPRVHISLSSMAEILKYDISQPGRETAGLLIGEEIDGEVHIDEIRIGKQTGNAVHVEISDDELTQAAIDVSTRTDGKVIVGWWHTHPGLSAFLSGTDIRTQSLYQAFMHNAVAIVVDDVKYSKTFNLDDLDFGVFRVDNNAPVRMPYSIKEMAEFGLATFLQRDQVIIRPQAGIGGGMKTKYFVPTLQSSEIAHLRRKLRNIESDIDPSQSQALDLWLDMSEAITDGVIKEVPIEVDNMLTELDKSIYTIGDTIDDLRDEIANSAATKSLLAMFLALITEILFFLFFFN